ncbi:MAG TPA: cyclodeaminase/cyclohydrolase family protein [Ktedonobacteraceae bacterium]
MYLEKPLQDYLDDLASAKPAPGGGSASALSAAMGASLASMVARLTLAKADYAAVHAEIEQIVQQTEQLRSRFQELMRADIEAYGNLSASFKLPRVTAEEKAARTQAVQERLVEAALVPLELAEGTAQLVTHCKRLAEIGNKNVISDIATGTMLASGAGTGASWMVRTNLQAMKNQELVESLGERLSVALDTLSTASQDVIKIVGERA